jgi:protein phosphatase PTC7
MDTDSSIYSYIKDSFTKLSKFFYYANYRLKKKQNKRLYRISFKKVTGLTKTNLMLIQNSKTTTILMQYSIKYKEYFLEIWLEPRTEFLISQPGQNFLIDSFPQSVKKSGELFNYIPEIKTQSQLYVTRSHLKSNYNNYKFESSGYSIGKPYYLNEDAYFCTEKVLGVADGIGSLQKEFGISSHEFSTELMRRCEQITRSHISVQQKKRLTCRDIIKHAYNSVECGGSSTFVLASLHGKQLNILNLGDSGLIVIRFLNESKIVFQTSPKVHSFNTPYQLSRKFSKVQLNQAKKKEILFDKSDQISDSDEYMITVVPGDLIIMGSDGLWDNLFPEEILKIVKQSQKLPVHNIAASIAKIAKIKAFSDKKTPFSNTYNNFTKKKQYYCGGKIDDITVVVAKIESF